MLVSITWTIVTERIGMDRHHPRLPPLLHISPPAQIRFTEILIAKTSANDKRFELVDRPTAAGGKKAVFSPPTQDFAGRRYGVREKSSHKQIKISKHLGKLKKIPRNIPRIFVWQLTVFEEFLFPTNSLRCVSFSLVEVPRDMKYYFRGCSIKINLGNTGLARKTRQLSVASV